MGTCKVGWGEVGTGGRWVGRGRNRRGGEVGTGEVGGER